MEERRLASGAPVFKKCVVGYFFGMGNVGV